MIGGACCDPVGSGRTCLRADAVSRLSGAGCCRVDAPGTSVQIDRNHFLWLSLLIFDNRRCSFPCRHLRRLAGWAEKRPLRLRLSLAVADSDSDPLPFRLPRPEKRDRRASRQPTEYRVRASVAGRTADRTGAATSDTLLQPFLPCYDQTTVSPSNEGLDGVERRRIRFEFRRVDLQFPFQPFSSLGSHPLP